MLRTRLPALAAAAALALVSPTTARTDGTQPTAPLAPALETSPLERVTFDEAVRRATERNPTVGQAAQAILRAQAQLDRTRSVFFPLVDGSVGSTILDDARGFDGNITQPRTQSAFSATLSYSFLAAARWAEKNHAADRLGTVRISAEETRRQVAFGAAQSYLAVIATKRTRDISMRNRDTAKALAEYSRARLAAGQGSRLNHVRSSQELATAEGLLQLTELAVREAQEALGIALFADDPIDASGDAALRLAALPPHDDAWLSQRPDVRLSVAELQAAERVVSDSWKSWLPTGTASFTPRYVTPAGLFEPSKTWRALFQLEIPIYDGTLGATKRVRIADRETARLRLAAVKARARSELRLAQEAVLRCEQILASSREAADNAGEALRITEIAYKAGATSNIEVVQAQQAARNLEIVAAQAEDRLQQARLDLLVALGQFPQ